MRSDTWRDSKTHSSVPSGFICDHQRSPTSRRPEMFFTVQKSKASSSTMTTNAMAKEEAKRKFARMYTTTASTRNTK